MAFFIQILSYWLILWLVSKVTLKQQLSSHALKARLAFSLGFIVVGFMHLFNPGSLTYMIEDFLPYAEFWVYLTGVIEIALAVLLHIRKIQKTIAWLIIVYLIAIFPANIYVAIENLPPPGGLPPQPWYVWSRLFFQPLYILWVYWSSIKPEKKLNFSTDNHTPRTSEQHIKQQAILSDSQH